MVTRLRNPLLDQMYELGLIQEPVVTKTAPSTTTSNPDQVRIASGGSSSAPSGIDFAGLHIPAILASDIAYTPYNPNLGIVGDNPNWLVGNADEMGEYGLSEEALKRYFPQGTPDANTFRIMGGRGISDATLRNVMIKTGKEEGTIIPFTRQGDYFVPDLTKATTTRWVTNPGEMNRALALGLAGIGAAGLLSPAITGAGNVAAELPGLAAGADAAASSILASGAAETFAGASAALEAAGLGRAAIAPAIDAVSKGSTVGNILKGAGGAATFFGDIGKILDVAQGGKKTTQTTGSNITEEGMMRIIQQIMENPNFGLSGILTEQARSGGYGASMTNLMINDLITRAAGEAAKASAQTTTTTRQGIGGSELAGGLESVVRLIGGLFK